MEGQTKATNGQKLDINEESKSKAFSEPPAAKKNGHSKAGGGDVDALSETSDQMIELDDDDDLDDVVEEDDEEDKEMT